MQSHTSLAFKEFTLRRVKRRHRSISLKHCSWSPLFYRGKKHLKRISQQATVGGEGMDSEREPVAFTLLYRPQGYLCFLTEKLLKVSKTFFSSLVKSWKFCIYRTDVLCYKFFSFLIEIDMRKNSYHTNSGGSSISNGMIKNLAFCHCFVFHL